MHETLFGKAIPRTLRSEVVDMLRDAIVSGRLKPGEHLKEIELAERMQVSRSPVREAFRQLEQEGLLVAVPNQGCYVKIFSAKEVEEIFTLRAALENLACELIIGESKMHHSDWLHLEMLIAQQKEAVQAQAFSELTKLDMDFHEFICQKADSQLLLQTWQGLRGQIQVLFYQRFHLMEEVPKTVDTDHQAILDALREANVAKITKINRAINQRVALECIEVFALNGREEILI